MGRDADDFEISSTEKYFCPYFEPIAWSHECLECTIDLFLAEEDLAILYGFLRSIDSYDLHISQAYTGWEDARVIEK